MTRGEAACPRSSPAPRAPGSPQAGPSSHTVQAEAACLARILENQSIKRALRAAAGASDLNDLKLVSFVSKNSPLQTSELAHVKLGERRCLGKSEPRRRALLLRTFQQEEQRHSPGQLSPGRRVPAAARGSRRPVRGHGRWWASPRLLGSQPLRASFPPEPSAGSQERADVATRPQVAKRPHQQPGKKQSFSVAHTHSHTCTHCTHCTHVHSVHTAHAHTRTHGKDSSVRLRRAHFHFPGSHSSCTHTQTHRGACAHTHSREHALGLLTSHTHSGRLARPSSAAATEVFRDQADGGTRASYLSVRKSEPRPSPKAT